MRLHASILRPFAACASSDCIRCVCAIADQIVTKTTSVYLVALPPTVERLLDTFSLTVSFGFTFNSVTSVLACLGLSGYLNQLLFWIIAPWVLVVAILVGALLHLSCNRRYTRTALMEAVLPPLLRIFFVLYPIIVQTAFEAFSCYTFDAGTALQSRFLIAEYATVIKLRAYPGM